MTITIDALRAAQLEEYPDSRFCDIAEAIKWAWDYPQYVTLEADRVFNEYIANGFSAHDARVAKQAVESDLQVRHRESVMTSLLVALANAVDSGAPVQFYECGLQPDGTYKWRGCRYGVKPNEYSSGFYY